MINPALPCNSPRSGAAGGRWVGACAYVCVWLGVIAAHCVLSLGGSRSTPPGSPATLVTATPDATRTQPHPPPLLPTHAPHLEHRTHHQPKSTELECEKRERKSSYTHTPHHTPSHSPIWQPCLRSTKTRRRPNTYRALSRRPQR